MVWMIEPTFCNQPEWYWYIAIIWSSMQKVQISFFVISVMVRAGIFWKNECLYHIKAITFGTQQTMVVYFHRHKCPAKSLFDSGSRDSSVVRASDSWLKGCGFKSLQERRENFLLHGQLSVLILISVSVPPPCYRSSTWKIPVILPKVQAAGYS